jgi:hypothetical protein
MVTDDPQRVERQLQLIVKVLAAFTVQGKNLSEGAGFLDRLGLDRAVIAEIYDTSPGSVRAALSSAKKGTRKGQVAAKSLPKAPASEVGA